LHTGNPIDDAWRSSYRLATGERLNTINDHGVFETLDGSRIFTLRGIA